MSCQNHLQSYYVQIIDSYLISTHLSSLSQHLDTFFFTFKTILKILSVSNQLNTFFNLKNKNRWHLSTYKYHKKYSRS